MKKSLARFRVCSSGLASRFGSRGAGAVGAVAGLGLASVALAGDPTLPAIDFPIDNASVVSSIATAGATILLLVIGVMVAFYLTRRFARKVMRAV